MMVKSAHRYYLNPANAAEAPAAWWLIQPSAVPDEVNMEEITFTSDITTGTALSGDLLTKHLGARKMAQLVDRPVTHLRFQMPVLVNTKLISAGSQLLRASKGTSRPKAEMPAKPIVSSAVVKKARTS